MNSILKQLNEMKRNEKRWTEKKHDPASLSLPFSMGSRFLWNTETKLCAGFGVACPNRWLSKRLLKGLSRERVVELGIDSACCYALVSLNCRIRVMGHSSSFRMTNHSFVAWFVSNIACSHRVHCGKLSNDSVGQMLVNILGPLWRVAIDTREVTIYTASPTMSPCPSCWHWSFSLHSAVDERPDLELPSLVACGATCLFQSSAFKCLSGQSPRCG